jgi:hypothetical protein
MGSGLTNAPKHEGLAIGSSSNTNTSQLYLSGPVLSLLPSWAVSAIHSLAGKAASVFYVVFLILLVTLLAVRIAFYKKPAGSSPEDELDT